MLGSWTYHSGGTGIRWSMTEAASAAPFCLTFDLNRLSFFSLTVLMLSKSLRGVYSLYFGEDGLANVLS